MHDRHCYATTGAHIIVLFEVNGQPMGSEIRLPDANTPRTIAFNAIGTGVIKRIDLLRRFRVGQASLLVRRSRDGLVNRGRLTYATTTGSPIFIVPGAAEPGMTTAPKISRGETCATALWAVRV